MDGSDKPPSTFLFEARMTTSPTISFPGESPAYREARNQLLQKEYELRRLAESVAQARRALPPGGAVPEDYLFHETTHDGTEPVKLSSLFGKNDTLFMYSYMFGPERARPCPMCTALLDGLNGVEDHLRQRVSVAVVAESKPEKLRAWAEERGWKRLRLLSAAGTKYNHDYGGTVPGMGDIPAINVFRRDGSTVRHFWSVEMTQSDPGQDGRGGDMINPIFNMFDMTPEGRGSFYTKLTY
jgi:predicted dithiol-disulfide oxidoreductase (DUF899 family)